MARQQHTKAWELRATTRFTRLWHRHDKHHGASQMVSAIDNWFAEGGDTIDLPEAQALL